MHPSKQKSHASTRHPQKPQGETSFGANAQIQMFQDSSLAQGAEAESFFQPKLNLHSANDPFEVEADQMADKVSSKPNIENIASQQVGGDAIQTNSLVDQVTRINASHTQRKPAFFSPSELDNSSGGDDSVQMKEEEDSIQGKEANKSPSKSFESRLNSSKGSGQSLPGQTQSQMESGFGADFSEVKVHTGSDAVQMSQSIGAEAFTHGNDIYFNEGKFQPGTGTGDHLIAHELTHTIQQGGVQRKAIQAQRNGEEVQASFIREVIDDLVYYAGAIGIDVPRIVDNIPGYTLFSYVIEFDIIRNQKVERNGNNLIRGLMGLVPGGNLLYEKLNEYKLIDKAFAWLEVQLNSLNISLDRIEKALSAAYKDMDFARLTGLISYNLGVLDGKFRPIYNEVKKFASDSVDRLLALVKEGLLKPLVAYLEENSEAYKLATKVIGKKFPLDEKVEATTEQILKDFLILIGKKTEVEEMEKKGTLKKTANWIDKQLLRFFSLLGRFQVIVDKVWTSISIDKLSDIPNILYSVWDDAKALFQDFMDFAYEVAAKVLEFIKDALLQALDSFATHIPGYHLLTIIIEKNPFTGKKVERSTENVIRGFMGLVPGGESKFQELKKTGVIANAVARIDALIKELGMSPGMVIQLFTDLWNSFTIDDLLKPKEAFQRIVDKFGEPIAKLFRFVVKMVRIVVELILQMIGIPPELIQSIISNAMQAFEDIKNDPLNFLINLIKAIGLGFKQFFDNFLKHLLGGLQNWLFGQLKKAGIEPPPDISAKNVLVMAMNVLGLTIDNLFLRLEKKIGKEKVDKIRQVISGVQGALSFIKDFQEGGPAALFDRIKDKISNLWSIITDGIKNFVMEKVIQKVITKILSSLEPTGIMAVINSASAFFDAVNTFIEKLKEILQIINSFTQGLVNIAKGNLSQAATFLENALAKGLPVAIAFFAKQAGLDDLGKKLAVMIGKAKEKINEAIDWLIDKVLQGGKALMNFAKNGFNSAKEALMGILGIKKPFTNVSGKKHKVYFEDRGGKVELIRSSSDKSILSAYFTRVDTEINALEDGTEKETYLEAVKKAKRIAADINKKRLEGKSDGGLKTDKRNQLSPSAAGEVNKLVEKLVVELAKLPEDFSDLRQGSKVVPASYFIYSVPITSQRTSLTGKQTKGDGQGAVGHLVSLRSGPDLGTKANYSSDLYGYLKNTLGRDVVQGHIIHDDLHGPGNEAKNIVPLPSGINRSMGNAEGKIAKEIKSENKVYYYKVVVDWPSMGEARSLPRGGATIEDELLPKKLTLSSAEMEFKPKTPPSSDQVDVEKAKFENWQKKGAVQTKEFVISSLSTFSIPKAGDDAEGLRDELLASAESRKKHDSWNWSKFRGNHKFKLRRLKGMKESYFQKVKKVFYT